MLERPARTTLPIQYLLNRIRWDEGFGRAEFSIGYYDRLAKTIIVMPPKSIAFPRNPPGVFELVDHQGGADTSPLHRIKKVGYRNGELIRQRTHRLEGGRMSERLSRYAELVGRIFICIIFCQEPRKTAFPAVFLFAKPKHGLGLACGFNHLRGRKRRGIPAPYSISRSKGKRCRPE